MTRPPTTSSDRVALGPGLVAIALLTVAAALALGLAAHRLAFRDRIHPGVAVGGVAVGGLTAPEALDVLADAGYDPAAPVPLRAGGATWSVEPAAAGVAFDARATVAEAYGVGRDGPLAALSAPVGHFVEHRVAPIITMDRDAARRLMEHVADGFDIAATDASLAIEGTTVHETAATHGRALNVEGALAVLAAAVREGNWPVRELELPYSGIAPEVTSAGAAVLQARALLEAPVHVRRDTHDWALEPAVVAGMLMTRIEDGEARLAVDEGLLAAWLAPAVEVISTTARSPRFHFDTEGKALEVVRPGEPARRVDVAATARQLLEAPGTVGRTAIVAVDETPPEIPDDVSAEALGIRELVIEDTSRFVGSPSQRIHNIQLAAAQFDGVLVPPDAVLSFNEAIGDITSEAGYEETLIIMDGTTTDGVGGGVCQVSTTLFRAALRSGMPIVERQAHGYRVGYYEQGADPGLDATVYKPQVDLKWRNDTGAWLLVETDTDPRAATLTFRFYGTRPAREVEILPARVAGIVPPPAASVVVDPALAPGQTRILEHSRAGASASVTRVIRANGEAREEVFHSRYRPTGQVTAVSPAVAPQSPSPWEAPSAALGVTPAPQLAPGGDTALP